MSKKHHKHKHKHEHEKEKKQEEKEEETQTQENQKDYEKEIEELKAKVAELEDKYLRANAEFENFKKRMEREKAEAVAYAHEEFARDLLPAIDSLELAINSLNEIDAEKEIVDKMKEGINLTIEQFKKAFEKHGIKVIDIDEGFNPHFHEAVMQVDSDQHNKGDIVQVFQKGYMIKDRILRPTMVSIAK
ncbi:MAG: nucleotide exchange factor GrpE [Epsilonproteobacteria bacterium]|nr:nucleotide exchange factor GrpE [Campylobacterota bacterium]